MSCPNEPFSLSLDFEFVCAGAPTALHAYEMCISYERTGLWISVFFKTLRRSCPFKINIFNYFEVSIFSTVAQLKSVIFM